MVPLIRVLISLVVSVALTSAVARAAPPLPIGAEDDWAPFSSSVQGKPTGMAVDIVKAIFAEAGIEIELRSLPYKRCMTETEAGRIAGCFDTTPDDELKRTFLFHRKPLFSDPTLILARVDNKAGNLSVKELEGKRVAVTNGYTYGDEFESNTRINKEVVLRDINGLRMLDVGRVDYAIVYRTIFANLLKGEGSGLKGKFKSAGTLRDNDLFLSFSRKFPDTESIMERFNTAHARLIANGAIRRIEAKWQ